MTEYLIRCRKSFSFFSDVERRQFDSDEEAMQYAQTRIEGYASVGVYRGAYLVADVLPDPSLTTYRILCLRRRSFFSHSGLRRFRSDEEAVCYAKTLVERYASVGVYRGEDLIADLRPERL